MCSKGFKRIVTNIFKYYAYGKILYAVKKKRLWLSIMIKYYEVLWILYYLWQYNKLWKYLTFSGIFSTPWVSMKTPKKCVNTYTTSQGLYSACSRFTNFFCISLYEKFSNILYYKKKFLGSGSKGLFLTVHRGSLAYKKCSKNFLKVITFAFL